MRKTLQFLTGLVSIVYLFPTLLNAQSPSEFVHFPDEKFKAELIGDKNINPDKDENISYEEAGAFKGTINISNKDISNMQGIEAFINVKKIQCQNNKLTSLDVSACTSLEVLHCQNNDLISLNLANGNNVKLSDMKAKTNPNLECIQIDQSFTPPSGGWNKDNNAYYGENCRATLPVELLSFRGRLDGEHIVLEWYTASEENNDYFEVERSKDGVLFETINEVDGAGTTTIARSYSSYDTDPFIGVNYYRLKQVDFDGQLSYSDIIAVRYDGDGYEVSPNPIFNKTIELNSTTYQNQVMTFHLSNLEGKILKSGTVEFINGKARIDLSDIPNLNASIYLVTLLSETNTPIVRKVSVLAD